jgi:hypothetical protein
VGNQWTSHNKQGDPDVIVGAEFAIVLRKWLDKWYEERPSKEAMGGSFGNERQFYSPYKYLHDHTGIHDRRLRGLASGEFKYVSLHKYAIPILDAIDHPEYLHNGTLEVIRSPYWSQEDWAEYMKERGCY